jgi:hypothetical protein
MTTRQSTFSCAHAHASPWAAFPAEMEITPRAFSSTEREASFASIPLGLKEPVFWKSSAFRYARPPNAIPRVPEERRGVRCRRPAIALRAASTSTEPATPRS